MVTGGASGIGLALAALLGAAGMKLVLADIELSALDDAAASLAAQGFEVEAVVTDVSDADQVVCISELEAAFARNRHGAPPVHIIEARLRDPTWTHRAFDQRRDVILVAGLAGCRSRVH